MGKCYACNGKGSRMEYHNGNPNDIGYEECSHCHGSGVDDHDIYIEIDDDWILEEGYDD